MTSNTKTTWIFIKTFSGHLGANTHISLEWAKKDSYELHFKNRLRESWKSIILVEFPKGKVINLSKKTKKVCLTLCLPHPMIAQRFPIPTPCMMFTTWSKNLWLSSYSNFQSQLKLGKFLLYQNPKNYFILLLHLC